MRSFIAIELPQNIKDYLSRLQTQLKNSQADVKWVEPQNIHLTLKFLGEIDDNQLSEINNILENIAKERKHFQANVSSAGAFPKINFPRVIWVGLKEGDQETQDIARYLEEKIAEIGVPKENRPFSSHITIGRVRTPKNKDKLVKELNKFADGLKEENLKFLVNKLTLFKSTLKPLGPVYEILKEVNLKTA